jgi:hypothetical protein
MHLSGIERRLRQVRPCSVLPDRPHGACAVLLAGDMNQHRCMSRLRYPVVAFPFCDLCYFAGGGNESTSRTHVPRAQLHWRHCPVHRMGDALDSRRDHGRGFAEAFRPRAHPRPRCQAARGRRRASARRACGPRVQCHLHGRRPRRAVGALFGLPGMPASMDDDMLASASILSLRNQTRMAMEPAQVLRWARRAGRVV